MLVELLALDPSQWADSQTPWESTKGTLIILVHFDPSFIIEFGFD